ncbi:hypothetical protein [Rathayibacter soli]|uniref:hypothetical protein n=1 Tax=Rathayibacter soli TaxID=3144168 RepID=UPI0027E3DD78|nr:hypothetical protein [Glaciibacter superstes]
MRRIRTLKPEFFSSEDVAALPVPVRLTFAGLFCYADDYGRANANAALVKASVWPLDDDVTTGVVDEYLLTLAEGGQIKFYTVGPRTYLQIVNWARHQKVDRPSKSNIPAPPNDDTREDLASPREQLVGEGRGEGEREEGEGEYVGGEGEREGETGGAQGNEGATPQPREPDDEMPPSPFCRSHPQGTEQPCRACGNARQRHGHWVEMRMARESRRPVFAESEKAA